MTRRAAAVLAALVTAGAAGLLADDWRPVRDDPRPNVVIVLTDDQTADSLEAMPYLSSRREDSADHWVDLRNAIVSTPMCCPSRASLLTGRYAHNTGVVTNLDGGLLDEASTLAVWLDDAGYETALVGKYLNGYPFGRGPYVPPGWDRWVAKMQGGPDSVYYRYTLAEQDLPVAHGSAPGDYLTDVLADRAATFVQEALPDRPFFLLFAPTAPHYPWTPAPRHLEAVQSFSAKAPGSLNEADVSDKPEWVRSLPPLSDPQLRRLERQRGRERAALLAVDESIRRIVDALRERGELDETVIFFLTDNGVAFGEHRWRARRRRSWCVSRASPRARSSPSCRSWTSRRRSRTSPAWSRLPPQTAIACWRSSRTPTSDRVTPPSWNGSEATASRSGARFARPASSTSNTGPESASYTTCPPIPSSSRTAPAIRRSRT